MTTRRAGAVNGTASKRDATWLAWLANHRRFWSLDAHRTRTAEQRRVQFRFMMDTVAPVVVFQFPDAVPLAGRR
jgi:hypothetical protein